MSVKAKIMLWLYRSFTYFLPAGLALWTFVVDKLIDNNVSIIAKIGVSGIFIIVVVALIGLHFYKNHFQIAINKLTLANNDLTDRILLTTSDEEKTELLEQKQIIRDKILKKQTIQSLVQNISFVAPFVLCWLACMLIEKQMVSLRGTFLPIILSMSIGFVFNIFFQKFKNE